VVLSFILPIPVIALVIFTRRKDVMGRLVNRASTSILAVVCTAVILALNALLIFETLGGKLPDIS
jgi:manganese transport protein